MNFEKEEIADLCLKKLKMRFDNKIDFDQYYLSYSGGRDSDFLRWFIVDYMHCKTIPIISVNTYREHRDIVKRIYDNSTVVLYPAMKFEEIKDKHGMPCFTKFQDEMISRHQRGSRAQSTLDFIAGAGTYSTKFHLNKNAKSLIESNALHKVSNKCCFYTKKQPLKIYELETGLKPIIAVRGSESITRKSKYKTCLNVNGHFTPMYDISDEMMNAVKHVYDLSDPAIYDHIDRTGCIGCPYGRNIEKELSLVTTAQRNYAIKSFGDSYKAKNIHI